MEEEIAGKKNVKGKERNKRSRAFREISFSFFSLSLYFFENTSFSFFLIGIIRFDGRTSNEIDETRREFKWFHPQFSQVDAYLSVICLTRWNLFQRII